MYLAHLMRAWLVKLSGLWFSEFVNFLVLTVF